MDRSRHFCKVLAKNKASFCAYPEILSEGEFKESVLICLAGEILRHNDIQAGVEEEIIIHGQLNIIVKRSSILHQDNGSVFPCDQHTSRDSGGASSRTGYISTWQTTWQYHKIHRVSTGFEGIKDVRLRGSSTKGYTWFQPKV